MKGAFRAWAAAIAAGVSACALGPERAEPDVAAPAAFSRELAVETAALASWWLGFEDETLDALVEQALAGNLDIAEADARLDQAAAFISAERSDLFPVVDGFVEGVRTEGAPSQGFASAGLAGVFNPDLFGARRRELQAARASAEDAAARARDARRIVAASLASAYIEVRRTDARLALLDTSLALQSRTVEIVRRRAEAGLAADLDVRRTVSDLASTRAQRGLLVSSRRAADNAVSLLLGAPPASVRVAPQETPSPPRYSAGPPLEAPSQVLRMRPDVRAAEARLARETALVGAEIADLFPNLTITGGVSSNLDGALFAGGAPASIAGILDAPLLDFGRRRAEVRAQRASAAAAEAAYKRTALSALSEVETALTAIAAARDRRADLAEAAEASEAAFTQLQALYREGLADLIDVLDAQRSLIGSRERFVDSEAALAQAIVDFYAALGV